MCFFYGWYTKGVGCWDLFGYVWIFDNILGLFFDLDIVMGVC